MIRCAYVCADPGIPVFGSKGSSIHVQEVIRAMRNHGIEVTLFASRFGNEAGEEFDAIARHELPRQSGGKSPADRERDAVRTNGALSKMLCSEGPFDLVYERHSLWSDAAMQYSQSCGIPGLLEVNAPLIEEQARYRGLVDREQAERIARRSFRVATALIAVSAGVARYLRDFAPDAGPVHVVPNGVDPGRFGRSMRPSRPAAAGTFTVGFVGTLKPWHGLTILVDALDRLPRLPANVRLLVVGDGPERESLERELRQRRVEAVVDVEFTGKVPPVEIPGLLASMDVAVAPYPDLHDFYFSPLKVYEYMAAGIAVVCSRIGQLNDVIADGVNGRLCPPGDAVALSQAIDELRGDRQLRHSMGSAARATVIEKHTWNAVLRRSFQAAGLGHFLADAHAAARS